ncbi:MAG: PQQ-like beta-propeller repeat protein, partial [Planctomycetes bacterium]|nr:PQQ-like beta-propeller repeat protein [Planctomycetota bacterium]
MVKASVTRKMPCKRLWMPVVAVGALWLCALTTDGEPPNVLGNGDFEKGPGQWTADALLRQHGSFAVEQDAQRDGRVAVLVNRSSEATVAAAQQIPVTAGRVYELSGFSRSTKLQEGAGVAVHALAADGRVLERRWAHQIPEWGIQGWREFRGQYAPPKNAATLEIRLSIYKQGQVWFDDLKLVARDPEKRAAAWGQRLDDFGLAVMRHETKRPIYRLAVADLDGDGAAEVVIGDIDGALRCQQLDGKVLWERDAGGLAMSLDCGDLGGDGKLEVVVCSADVRGAIHVFGADGQPKWTHSVEGSVFGHVRVADVNGDGRCEVFATYGNQLVALSAEGKELWRRDFGGPRMRDIAVGDVTGDGKPEVVVSLESQSLFAAAFSPDGAPVWQFRPVGGPNLSGGDIVVADVDGDGKAEAVMASDSGQVVCIADGKIKWLATREKPKLWPSHRDATMNLGSTVAQIAVADFAPERPGLETLVALVDSAWLLDKDGQFIWDTQSGLLLGDLVIGPGGAFYAPSSGFRDRSLYTLKPSRGQGNPLASYKLANPIYDELAKIRTQLDTREKLSPPARPTDKFHVIFANLPWPSSSQQGFDGLRQMSEFLKAQEGDQLEFIVMLWPKDLPVELHRGQMIEKDEILRVVKLLEELGRPFLFFADHGCAPNLSLEVIAETLRLAPRTCRGFYVAENTANYPSQKWDEFVDWAMKVMDLCLQHGG